MFTGGFEIKAEIKTFLADILNVSKGLFLEVRYLAHGISISLSTVVKRHSSLQVHNVNCNEREFR